MLGSFIDKRVYNRLYKQQRYLIMKNEYPALDMSILKSKQRRTVSTAKTLKDVTPIDWGEDAENGKAKAFIAPGWMYENVEQGRRDKNNHLVLAEDWN